MAISSTAQLLSHSHLFHLAFPTSSKNGKKLCKKMRYSPKTYTVYHYLKGELNKEYDRRLVAASFKKFVNVRSAAAARCVAPR